MNTNKYKYMVCTRCFTYNHAPFIESALHGFAFQETFFPMVFVIVDDYSSDGEPDILRKWAENNLDFKEEGYAYNKKMDYGQLLFARHKDKRNVSFAIILLSENHFQIKKSRMKFTYIAEWLNNAKYHAICEGDDYWIDPEKLQKQVDFLERHPNHTLCIHAYRRDEYNGTLIEKKEINKYPNDVEIIPDEDVINGTGMFCATASMVYRASAVKDYPDWARRAPVGDRPLKFVLFARGHIAYLNEIMSVYRVGVPGSWTVRVNRNRNASRKTRKMFVQLLVDFDNWTQKRYHSLIQKAIRNYRKSCIKQDLQYYIKDPARFLKTIIFR